MNFASPILLFVGLAILGIFAWRTWLHPLLRQSVRWSAYTSLLLLTLSLGELRLSCYNEIRLVVMVDVSPSTRTAAYRDHTYFRRTLQELLRGRPFQLIRFADTNLPDNFTDAPGALRTRFSPPSDADAVVIFSDGQFPIPATCPPVFAVMDPELDRANDARVENIEQRDKQLAITFGNAIKQRPFELTNATYRGNMTIDPGHPTILAQYVDRFGQISASVKSDDAWPENNQLTLQLISPTSAQRWIVGAPAPSGWLAVDPGKLSADSSNYLNASIIAIPTEIASQLSPDIRNHLAQFTSGLGGTLIFTGSPAQLPSDLRPLCPLSESPPEPSAQWIILLDASGSMSGMSGGNSRWQSASDSLKQLLPYLPDNAQVSVGIFNRDLRWLVNQQQVRQLQTNTLDLSVITPTGPTQLQSALQALPGVIDPTLPTRVLVLSDADATITDPSKLSDLLLSSNITLHLLATDNVPANSPLRTLCQSTGGRVLVEADAGKWAQSFQTLYNSAKGTDVMPKPAIAHYVNDFSTILPRTISPWYQAWIKTNATPLAIVDKNSTAAALWQTGNGRVIAMAYSPTSAELNIIAPRFESIVRDPRLKISWLDNGWRVRVDVVERARPVNNIPLIARITHETGSNDSIPLTQTAPGTYEAAISRSGTTSIVTLQVNGTVVERRSLPGMYAEEFDHIGINHDTLQNLTTRTGGAIVEFTQHKPIQFPRGRRWVSCSTWLAAWGAMMLMVSFILLKAPYLEDMIVLRFKQILHR